MNKLNKSQLSHALITCVENSLGSGEISRLNAVYEIVEVERFRGIDGLIAEIRYDPVGFILFAAPGFPRALKSVTGKSREEWAELF
jgi:hypothetical protein